MIKEVLTTPYDVAKSDRISSPSISSWMHISSQSSPELDWVLSISVRSAATIADNSMVQPSETKGVTFADSEVHSDLKRNMKCMVSDVFIYITASKIKTYNDWNIYLTVLSPLLLFLKLICLRSLYLLPPAGL